MTSRTERGRLVASVLTGSWRAAPPTDPLPDDALTSIYSLLSSFGAGGLAWRSLSMRKDGETPSSKEAVELRQAYRMHALEAALRVRQIETAISLLRQRGIDPLLAKGWAAARHYSEPGLRPYGDIDLYVRPEVFREALASLSCSGKPPPVDLHAGCSFLDHHAFDTLCERAEIVFIGGTEVRVFGAEDHLHLLCVHALNHGLTRPLWLCDIGAIVESTPPGFDWDLFWSGSKRRLDWLACALTASQQILGAHLDGVPGPGDDRELPRWFIDAVHVEWGVPFHALEPMASYLPREGAFAFLGASRELLRHWPNPIEATVGVGGAFSRSVRWPYQLAYSALRSVRFVRRVTKRVLAAPPTTEHGPVPNGGAV